MILIRPKNLKKNKRYIWFQPSSENYYCVSFIKRHTTYPAIYANIKLLKTEIIVNLNELYEYIKVEALEDKI